MEGGGNMALTEKSRHHSLAQSLILYPIQSDLAAEARGPMKYGCPLVNAILRCEVILQLFLFSDIYIYICKFLTL